MSIGHGMEQTTAVNLRSIMNYQSINQSINQSISQCIYTRNKPIKQR